MNKSQKYLCILVSLAAAVLIAFLTAGYLSARRNLSGLKEDLSSSTAAWKQINEEKLEVQKELKAAKNELREADLTITESEERAKELEDEISGLEKEIELLKLQVAASGEQ